MKARHIIIAAVWLACGGFIWMTAAGKLAPSPESLLKQAREEISRHRLDSAERTLRRATAAKPDYANAHLALSRLLMRRNAFIEAFGCLHDALHADPLIIQSLDFEQFVDGLSQDAQHRTYLETFASLAENLAPEHVRPEHTGALELVAHLHNNQLQLTLDQAGAGLAYLTGSASSAAVDHFLAGEYDQAVEQLRLIEPASELANELAELVGRAQDLRDATRQAFSRILDGKPDFTAARLALALIDLQTGRTHQGIQAMLEMIHDLDSPSNGLLILAARTLAAHGRLLEAEPFVKKVLESEPQNVPARQMSAAMLFVQGRLDELEPVIHDFRAKNPSDTRMMFLLGALELNKGRHDIACHQLSKVIRDFPDWPPLLYHAGLAYYRTGNIHQADECLSKLTNRPGIFPEVRVALAAVRLAEDRPAHAEKLCREVLAAHENDPDALRLLAAACIAQGRADCAEDALARLLAAQPESIAAAEALAAARLSHGEVAGVIARHEANTADGGGSEADHRALAFAYSVSGDSQEAAEHYDLLQSDSVARAQAWLFRARMLALQGRTAAAAEQCRAAIRNGASAAAVLPVLGVLNTIQGRYSEAREQLAGAASPLAAGTLAANVYLALAPHEGYARAAQSILAIDPFSARSQSLLVELSAAEPGDLRNSLDEIVNRQPGLLGVMNKTVVLRRREAVKAAAAALVDIDSLWPRLIDAYRSEPLNWP